MFRSGTGGLPAGEGVDVLDLHLGDIAALGEDGAPVADEVELVRAGAKFESGVLVEREEVVAA